MVVVLQAGLVDGVVTAIHGAVVKQLQVVQANVLAPIPVQQLTLTVVLAHTLILLPSHQLHLVFVLQ